MCAPLNLSSAMEGPAISRFNSQSSNKTFPTSDNGKVSPIIAPIGFSDGSIQSPFIQTPDNRHWIDLNSLSPKLFEELRRQYDPSIINEPSGPLGKSAAKLKAFVRQTKRGIDIRLRRKVNADQDEVTDICLVPDFRAELPTVENEINELPDSSVSQELDTAHGPSRNSTGSSIGEPLPRYEPRREGDGASMSTNSNQIGASSIGPVLGTSLLSPMQHLSISTTPPEELSLPNSEHSNIGSEFSLNTTFYPDATRFSTKGDKAANPDAQYVEEPVSHLIEKPQIPESLQTIVSALQQKIVTGEGRSADTQADGNGESMFGPFRVAKKTTYETETDAEPSSPIRRKQGKSNGKRTVVYPKRKRSTTKAMTRISGSPELSNDSEEADGPETLLRKQTIPKRLPASSGAELLWSSLLRTQGKILGAEHPLVYKARSDFAYSRANGHSQGSNDLSSLTKSKAIAAETLGLVHPWVAAFAEELTTLESLLGPNLVPGGADTSNVERIAVNESANRQVEHDSSADTSQSQTEQSGNIFENGALPRTTESTHVSKESISQSPSASESRREIDDNGAMTSIEDHPSAETTKPVLPSITTSLPVEQKASSAPSSAARPAQIDSVWSTWRSPHEHRNDRLALPVLAFDALLKTIVSAVHWLQRNYGPEQPVQPGKLRVRWTCSCGEQLYDDFVERRIGAARELEAYLNRPQRQAAGGGNSPVSPSGSSGIYSHGNSSMAWPPSYQTSWSSYGAQGQGPMGRNGDAKPPLTTSTLPLHSQYSPFHEPPWLLTCANEDRYTPKLDHLNMAPHRITSDRDLAKSLREHYFSVNKRWWRKLRIRGLVSIEFVQLEVHQNRFADIRKCPDMPDTSREDYTFEPVDLIPPVGSQYLVHLFKHPEDYDGERITYLRAPKKSGRLYLGVGWGIHLVEGFLADRVWVLVSGFFALGSLAFVLAWELKKHNVQGASGVAAWIVSLGVLAVGWLQAFLG